MASEFRMPQLGLTMTEGAVGKWLKKTGEPVAIGDVLVEVETDKITSQVEATADGVLLEIVVPEGSTVPVKAVLAYIGEPGEIVSAAAAPTTNPAPAAVVVPAPATAAVGATGDSWVKASPAARKLARDNGIDLALVAVSGPSGMAIERDVRSFMEQKQTVKASPLAVKVAAEHAVNLAEIQKEGRIMKGDVLAVLSQPAIAAGEQIPLAGVPLSGMRKVIAERMSYSWQTCPHVHHTVEVDMAEAVLIKDKISKMGVKLSFTELIIKSVAKALAEFPMVNNSLINGSLVTNDSIHIGVAVALDNGLIVPVIRNANQKALSQLRAEVVDLSTRAREGKLTPDDYTGGTFTVSNLGMYGVDHFTPIVNPPESGILGVCRTVDKPVVVDGTIVIRPMMNLVLGYDHRVVDGALAGKFTARVRQLLEQPLLLI